MTNAQQKSIEVLKNEFFKYYSYGHLEEYELKEIYIEEWKDTETVYIRLEIGLIGDEGSLAEVFARNSTAVCIGKKGGYFSYHEFSHKKCSLNLLQAITWGFHCRQLRKKKMNKKEA